MTKSWPFVRVTSLFSLSSQVLISGPLVSSMIEHCLSSLCLRASLRFSRVFKCVYSSKSEELRSTIGQVEDCTYLVVAACEVECCNVHAGVQHLDKLVDFEAFRTELAYHFRLASRLIGVLVDVLLLNTTGPFALGLSFFNHGLLTLFVRFLLALL